MSVERLNYIGSKFKLFNWIYNNILEKTGWNDLNDKKIADIFAGTGIVSYNFRKLDANVTSNDVELYSYIITRALTCSIYNENIKEIIEEIQLQLCNKQYLNTHGFITKYYSPYNDNERMFFTVDNAMRIDYVRKYIEEKRNILSDNDYYFILASLIISADHISNVPAVYGCYLKKFKEKAMKELHLKPIHKLTSLHSNITYNNDVLKQNFLRNMKFDLVYLDPPYNARQYSKNYFPLNIIAKSPEELESEPELKGKTGIPTDCFVSPFCKKSEVKQAFKNLIEKLDTKWIFISYNSESLLNKQEILDIMKTRGNASVIEIDYKRFKSYEYNNDIDIKEYLFCLEVTNK